VWYIMGVSENRANERDSMEFNYGLLKQKIKDEYKTAGNFAAAMGITGTRLSLMLNGKAKWTTDMAFQAVQLLGVEDDIVKFFFTPKLGNRVRGERCSRTDF